MVKRALGILLLPFLMGACALASNPQAQQQYLIGPTGFIPIPAPPSARAQLRPEAPEEINPADLPGADISDEEGAAALEATKPSPYRDYANQPRAYRPQSTAERTGRPR